MVFALNFKVKGKRIHPIYNLFSRKKKEVMMRLIMGSNLE